jgi:hypothetical protein
MGAKHSILSPTLYSLYNDDVPTPKRNPEIEVTLFDDDRAKWAPFHHDMTCPQFMEGEDGPQTWRVAANIFNKQSRIADKEWSSSWGVWRELTTLAVKISLLRNLTKGR